MDPKINFRIFYTHGIFSGDDIIKLPFRMAKRVVVFL